MKPNVTFFGKGSLPWPLTSDVETKLRIITTHLAPTFVTSGAAGITHVAGARIISFPTTFSRFAGSLLFYSIGAFIAVFGSVGRARKVICCQSPYEGFVVNLVRLVVPPSYRPRVLIEVHGDYKTASRLYGSKARQVVSPLSDKAGSWALRKADRVRVVSNFLAAQVRKAGFTGPIDKFVAYSDFEAFGKPAPLPFPPQPQVAFVGAFENYKGIDTLMEGLKLVAGCIPTCRFSLAGRGRQLKWAQKVASSSNDFLVSFLGDIPRQEVVELLDQSSILVLPSKSEGLGRVILEAFARGRPVVASRVGGIVDLLEDGKTGLLVPPDDPEALAKAIVAILRERSMLLLMGEEARKEFLRWDPLTDFQNWIFSVCSWAQDRKGNNYE